ncbi:MAG: hypothetical protein IH810_05385 [Proteobacteria bacterium]|nr:hypothetical protein [Pseudomonadota bacterium]
MHKAILMMLLAAVSSSAMAEWVKVSEDKLVTAYADPTTIRKLGDKVKMWVMWDHLTAKVVNSKPHMSTRVQKEFNCKEETTRQIYASAFTDNMGRGDLINNEGGREWEPVAPRIHDEALWKFACGK